MTTRARINLNIDSDKKDQIQRKADKLDMTLTDYMVQRSLTDQLSESDTQALNNIKTELSQVKVNHNTMIALYEQQIRLMQETINNKQKDYDQLNTNYVQLQARYDITLQAMLWHSLPWYKKMGKQLELPNKQD